MIALSTRAVAQIARLAPLTAFLPTVSRSRDCVPEPPSDAVAVGRVQRAVYEYDPVCGRFRQVRVLHQHPCHAAASDDRFLYGCLDR